MKTRNKLFLNTPQDTKGTACIHYTFNQQYIITLVPLCLRVCVYVVHVHEQNKDQLMKHLTNKEKWKANMQLVKCKHQKENYCHAV